MSDFDDEPDAGPAPDDEQRVPTADRVPAEEPEPATDTSDLWHDEEDDAPPPRKARANDKKAEPQASGDDDWDDDWDDDDRGGRRDLTLVYAVVAAAIVIVLAIVLTQPNDDDNSSGNGTKTEQNGTAQPAEPTEVVKNWQGPVADAVGDKGADAQARAEEEAGVTIWTDFWGWHVRNNGPDPAVITVTADQVRLKATDDYNDDDEDGSAAFKTEEQVTLPAGDGSTGQGFDLGNSETATIAVTINGANVPFETIKLGGAEGVADANPVVFTKA